MIPVPLIVAILMGCAVSVSIYLLLGTVVAVGAVPAAFMAYRGNWRMAGVIALVTAALVGITMVVL